MVQRYEDETADNFPNDFNKKDIDSRVELRATAVRNKMYGDDVREAVAQAVEISSAVSTETKKTADDSSALSKDTQAQFKAVQQGATSDTEVKTARYSKADGKTYDVLTDRLDAMDKKPQQAVDDLVIGGGNLLLDTLTPRIITGTGASNVYAGDPYFLTKGALSGWMKSGVNYSLSFDWSVSAGATGTFTPQFNDIPWNSDFESATTDVSKAASGHFAVKLTSNDDWVSGAANGIQFITYNLVGNLTISNVKFELGDKATDWSPAPEDSHHHQAFRKGTRFFAHRGAQSIAPEDSLPAIRKAGNHAGVEIDIHVTSDGRWMVMHDGTVDRMTDSTGAISSYTFNDLRQIRLSKGNYVAAYRDDELLIPTLEEAFTACRDRQLIPVVEIKKDDSDHYTADNWDSLANIVTKFGLQDEMMFISFDYQSLQEVKKRLPLVEVQYLVQDITTNNIVQAQALGVNSGLDVNYTNQSVNDDNVQACHNAGLKVGVWTTNDDSQRQKLVGMGIDFITTNSLSGELRYQALNLQNGWKNYPGENSYVKEIAPGTVQVYFNIISGQRNNGLTVANLPDWATPINFVWSSCVVRTSNGVNLGTVNIKEELPTDTHLYPGLGWDAGDSNNSAHWVTGNIVYHI